MTRFNLYQGATLLPLLLMLLLQQWFAAGAIVVTLILVLIAVFSAVKKPLELQIDSIWITTFLTSQSKRFILRNTEQYFM